MLYRFFILIFACYAITSCSTKFKQKVGIVTSGPNEYAVQKYKPLEVPPHYELAVPTHIEPKKK